MGTSPNIYRGMTQCPTPSISGGQDRSPLMDPSWEYQLGIIRRDHRMLCLVEDMKQCIISVIKPVNYDMVKKITQGQDENPALFQARLVDAFRKYKMWTQKHFSRDTLYLQPTALANQPLTSIGNFKLLPRVARLLSAFLLTQPSVSLTIGTRIRMKRKNSMI